MRNIGIIARREYAQTVKTRTFLLSVLFTPLLVAGIIFFSTRFHKTSSSPAPTRHIAIVDRTESLGDDLRRQVDDHNRSRSDRPLELQLLDPAEDIEEQVAGRKTDILHNRLDAYLVLDPGIIEGAGKIHVYQGDARAAMHDYLSGVEGMVNNAVVNQRCVRAGLSLEVINTIRNRVPTEHIKVTAGGAERVQSTGQKMVDMMLPFLFMYLIFLGIFVMAQQILTSVIEEKSTRIMEVLLSAVRPFDLLAGKILGLAASGLTVMTLWCVAAYGAARWQGFQITITPAQIVYFIVYYILGFLLFSSLLAAVGSVCNTIKEAQSLMMPITLIFIIPMISWYNLARDPGGPLATALSYVPPLTPMVMMLRLSAAERVGWYEIAASIALLLVCVPVTMWLAAKVFRTGILMYGKRPTLGEIVRWLKAA